MYAFLKSPFKIKQDSARVEATKENLPVSYCRGILRILLPEANPPAGYICLASQRKRRSTVVCIANDWRKLWLQSKRRTRNC